MNSVFFILFFLSTGWFLIFSPDAFLPTLLSGAQKAASLCVFLLAVYSVWMGFMKTAEESGLHRGVAKLLRPAVKKLFLTEDEKAIGYLSMNLAANLLGVSGAATPYGIKGAKALEGGTHARVSHAMLLVINAAGIELIPTTVLSLLTAYHAQNPYSILLPTLISSVFTTGMGILLVRLFIKKG